MSEYLSKKNSTKNNENATPIKIAIAGNPNCGKTALFNSLTGIRQQTGNWPGVTVDRKEGKTKLGKQNIQVIDLPGIYSLDASSLDEQIALNFLLARDFDLIINVLDASNLERNLYLTIQLLEMGVPIVIALNMIDVAKSNGLQINWQQMSKILNCPVVPIVAVENQGIDDLKSQIIQVAKGKIQGGNYLAHEQVIEDSLSSLIPLLPESLKQKNRRMIALKALEGIQLDELTKIENYPKFIDQLEKMQKNITSLTGESLDSYLADSRYSHAHSIAVKSIQPSNITKSNLTNKIDSIVLNRYLGIPLFLMIMYLMFMFTINFGGAFIDFFDIAAGAIFIDGVGSAITSIGLPDWLRIIIADGIGGGIQIVATFIPIIAALFLFLSVLEDSGYIARAAFIMNRAMSAIGLPGRAFMPLIIGFGCNVPGIMATRSLESERERKLTILMNPFMSCGARLPVYVLFAAAFFPNNGQNIIFLLYLVGIVVAIITGLIMKQSLLTGESSHFIMELPTYHRPILKNILLRMWDRLKVFIQGAGKIIIVMVLILNLLNSIGVDGSFGNENSNNSILSATSKKLTPIFAPMGVSKDNWPAVVGIISGALAKEVVVGTLDNLYTNIAKTQTDNLGQNKNNSVIDSIKEAFSTIPINLLNIKDTVLDPLGLQVEGTIANQQASVEELEINVSTFGVMQNFFPNVHSVIAFMLFILLYMPCVAALGAIKRESGGWWMIFVGFWTTFIAYVTASVYYQLAVFTINPISSFLWILSLITIMVVVIMILRLWSKKHADDQGNIHSYKFASSGRY